MASYKTCLLVTRFSPCLSALLAACPLLSCTEATEAAGEREPMPGTDTREGGMMGRRDGRQEAGREESKQGALGPIFSHYYFRTDLSKSFIPCFPFCFLWCVPFLLLSRTEKDSQLLF